MTTRNVLARRSLVVVALTLLIAFVAPARQESSAQPSSKASARSAPRRTGTPAQAMVQAATSSRHFSSTRRPRLKKANSVSPDSGSSLFLPAVTYGTGDTYAYSIAIEDVNGDGKPDLLVANGSGGAAGSVGVLLGNGDGTFKNVVTYRAGGDQSSSVAVVDLNGDGQWDIVVSNTNGSNNVGVLLGNGDGTFRRVVTYSSGGGAPQSVWVADVNGDGKPDILEATDPGLVGVLLGNGDGTFNPAVMYSSGGYYAHSLAIEDVNGDGKLDVIVANRCTGQPDCSGDGSVGVLLGSGDGTFQSVVAYDSRGRDTDTVAVADVNGDGKLDVLVSNNNCVTDSCGTGTVGVLLGNGDGTFQPSVLYGSGGYSYESVAVADVNGDGKPDLVVASQCSSLVSNCAYQGRGIVGVLLGNGDGTFQAVLTYDSGAYGAVSVAVADLNGDSRPDLVVTSLAGVVGVLLNAGDSTLASTTTTLASLLNPSVYGQAVTFSAKVTSSSGTPTGTVNLLDGSTSMRSGTLTNGSAKIVLPSLPAGADLITAAYQGSASFARSTSAPLTQTVTVASTATGLSSSLNPAGTNQSVTFTATVTSQFGGAATGSVVFSSGSQTLGTASVSGKLATLTTSFSTAGTYSISAKYNGDGNNLTSASPTLSQVIIASTTTTLVSSLNPSVVGQAVTFTATVSSTSGTPPNGETITFKNGSAVLGTAPLTGGAASLTTSSLAAGIYTITASYAGDANFASSTSPGLRQVVNSTSKSATATTLISSLNPSIYGQKVFWTASVTTAGSAPPTGKVKFIWKGYSIGTVALNASGVATLTRSNLNADTYPLMAVYVGDASNLGSTSPIVNQVVTQATSATTLTSSPNPSTSGQAVTFTATITSPTVKPTGPLTFTAGKTVLGTAQLSREKATLTTSTLALGSTTVTATYSGDSNIAQSTASMTQTVTQGTASGVFTMPYDGTLYLLQEGGSAGASTEFGLGTSPTNFVRYYSGLPTNPTPVGEVMIGSFTAGTVINFAMFTQFGSQSGWAFSTGTDRASIVAFTDTDDSLGMGGSITQQTSSTTWLLHLDDALSYLYDDDDNDVLMQIRVAPGAVQTATTSPRISKVPRR